MFRSSMRSSSGSSLFTSLSMLLILKIIKIFKTYYHPSWLCGSILQGKTKFMSILYISNIDKEVNKELPEDDLIEDRNMLEYFLKCFKWFQYNLKDWYIVVWKSAWVGVNKTWWIKMHGETVKFKKNTYFIFNNFLFPKILPLMRWHGKMWYSQTGHR